MKRIGWLLMSLLMIMVLTACSSAPDNEEMTEPAPVAEMEEVVEIDEATEMEEADMPEETTMEEMSTDDDSIMSDADMMELTLEELKMYDGQNGQMAFVAIEGVIYDVTGIPAWTGGTHNGNMAGNDLTDVITKAPHGKKVLEKLTVVGKIVE